jgi:hypothetical protein
MYHGSAMSKVLSQHFPGGMEEEQNKPPQDKVSSGLELLSESLELQSSYANHASETQEGRMWEESVVSC